MTSLICDITSLPSLLKAQQEDFTLSPYTEYQARINDLTNLKKLLIRHSAPHFMNKYSGMSGPYNQ